MHLPTLHSVIANGRPSARTLPEDDAAQQNGFRMILLIDVVDCDALHKCIVKPEACRKALLVQDAGEKNDLFALLMVDDRRAVLVRQGSMNLAATGGGGMLKLQMFRHQLDKSGIRTKELRFCAPGTYATHLAGGGERFDPQWFAPASFPDIVERFTAWRAGRATW
jgi:hypothetical protein